MRQKQNSRALYAFKREVIIVTGAPGSGKSTYVQNESNQFDLVVDLDRICSAISGQSLHQNHKNILDIALLIRDNLYQSIMDGIGTWNRAFIICASSDRCVIEKLKKQFNATEHRMLVSREQCIQRIQNDETRAGSIDEFISLANDWYNNIEG